MQTHDSGTDQARQALDQQIAKDLREHTVKAAELKREEDAAAKAKIELDKLEREASVLETEVDRLASQMKRDKEAKDLLDKKAREHH